MVIDKDYRNTEFCIVLDRVREKKKALQEEISLHSPRTKIFYHKVKDRNSAYHDKFAQIYNNKCAYCGAQWGLLPVESFEIDHFLNIASFEDTLNGRMEAGKLINLVWSCISCNRGKSGITIKPPYDEVLNTDNGNIASVFKRDSAYYIKICDTYQSDEFIKNFYEKLHLGHEARRLDYLILQLNGKYQAEKDVRRKQKFLESLSLLVKKRNRTIMAGRS